MTPRYYWIFAGSYAPAAEEGVHVLRFDAVKGTLERVGGLAGIDNPSYLAVDGSRGFVFTVSETADEGGVVGLRFDRVAERLSLGFGGARSTRGAHPCHLALDERGEWLVAANYSGGSVCVFPVAADGTIGPMSDFREHLGRSVRDDRQNRPHPHSVNRVPGCGSWWLVPDLGADRIVVYRLDSASGTLAQHGAAQSTAGGGPRHLAFHPAMQYVYVINELASTVTVYRFDASAGELARVQELSALPYGVDGVRSTCAHIELSADGAFAYGSNRGHDSLAVFRVAADGCLQPLGHVPTHGRTPRNFTVIPAADGGRYVLVANQDSDEIVVLKAPSDEGIPVATGVSLRLRKPVCLVPLHMN